MSVWRSGCDGVLMFNNSGLRDIKLSVEQDWFGPDAGSYQEALAATVKGTDFVNALSKTYFVSFRGVGRVAGDALPHQRFQNLPTLNHHAPVQIAAGSTAQVHLFMADNLDAGQQAEPTATATAFISGDPQHLQIELNSQPLTF